MVGAADSLVTGISPNAASTPWYLRPGIGIMELRAKTRRLKAHHDIGIVVVDYLQLMRGPREDSRERAVAVISGGLKALARELDIPVLALSQIRRAAEERAGGRPQLADLRESGSPEQDADMVVAQHSGNHRGFSLRFKLAQCLPGR